MTGRQARGRTAEIVGVFTLVMVSLVVILSLRADLPTTPPVMSDALGPENGERVDDYLPRAAATLDASDDDPRWALVTAGWAWSVPEAAGVVRELPRVSGIYVQVPVDGVAMPVTGVTLPEPVAGETSREPVLERGLEQVITRLEAAGGQGTADPPTPAPPDPDRAAATAALTVARIRGGEPAIIGLLARGTPAELRAVADQPWVRAVEALPADAVWQRFAVRPLQPQQAEAALPLPDDGPLPPA
ncbi:hypothetical protein [Dietzia sp. 179-F 9C3 NHS]|uniref:hypothetical protein n=1 Tax=Dietzia sp. 179-F 9C3 NHS TaxID=3374295 RepID=UPI00387A47D9